MSQPKKPKYSVRITQEQANAILRYTADGYRDREDYPPFAVAPWEDRNRYREYLKLVLQDMVTR